jgi:hypothetical protein
MSLAELILLERVCDGSIRGLKIPCPFAVRSLEGIEHATPGEEAIHLDLNQPPQRRGIRSSYVLRP